MQFITTYAYNGQWLDVPSFFFAILLTLNVISFWGVSLLYKRKKLGYYLYIIAQLSLVISPHLMLSKAYTSVPGTIVTIIFIGMYTYNYPLLTEK
ncbi:hypothetical protein EYV94_10120 [Puteibacter caeruleilacunae]|nr:hypothetical protein EYV94_10120 [Puteibacter caeruleilacunae]